MTKSFELKAISRAGASSFLPATLRLAMRAGVILARKFRASLIGEGRHFGRPAVAGAQKAQKWRITEPSSFLRLFAAIHNSHAAR
jgi:hypothetical protein